MYFEQFYLTCLSHASYMIGSEGVAAVVDPQRDVGIYLEEARKNNLRIEHVIETHLHADFVSGHHELAAKTGAKIYLGWKADAKFDEIAIPDSLQALLMARIDRLDAQTKSTLQTASVIGRSFLYRILENISETAIVLDKQLGSLERAELLREAGRMPELEYIFKHDLARDAAYGSILNRKRRELHQRVAEAIEALFADRLEEHAHRIAQHFALAGDNQKALKYFEMAGEAAAGLHAEAEGAAHYAGAIEAARQLGFEGEAMASLEAKRRALAARSAPG